MENENFDIQELQRYIDETERIRKHNVKLVEGLKRIKKSIDTLLSATIEYAEEEKEWFPNIEKMPSIESTAIDFDKLDKEKEVYEHKGPAPTATLSSEQESETVAVMTLPVDVSAEIEKTAAEVKEEFEKANLTKDTDDRIYFTSQGDGEPFDWNNMTPLQAQLHIDTLTCKDAWDLPIRYLRGLFNDQQIEYAKEYLNKRDLASTRDIAFILDAENLEDLANQPKGYSGSWASIYTNVKKFSRTLPIDTYLKTGILDKLYGIFHFGQRPDKFFRTFYHLRPDVEMQYKTRPISQGRKPEALYIMYGVKVIKGQLYFSN